MNKEKRYLAFTIIWGIIAVVSLIYGVVSYDILPIILATAILSSWLIGYEMGDSLNYIHE